MGNATVEVGSGLLYLAGLTLLVQVLQALLLKDLTSIQSNVPHYIYFLNIFWGINQSRMMNEIYLQLKKQS